MDLNQTGLFISALRKQNNMTQNDLAEKIGVTDKAVSRWETGKGFPDISLLPTLAEALGVSISELVMGEKIEVEEKITMEIMDKAVVRTISTFDDSPRTQRARRRAALFRRICKRVITLAVVCLIAAVFFVQIPLSRVRSINPQIERSYNHIDDRFELVMYGNWRDKIHYTARELTRGGKLFTVIYFYPSQTLIKRLTELTITDSVVNDIPLAERRAGEDLKTVEVYYLPANIRRLGELDDVSYDCERYNGILIWSGFL